MRHYRSPVKSRPGTIRAASAVMMLAMLALLFLAGCTPHQTGARPHPNPSATLTVGGCRYGHLDGQVMPDVRCTPGALNPAVTQATIRSTICVSGWTATVRPPVSWTSQVKARSKAAYGQPPNATGELDHFVPLELGGAPADTLNLWFEPGSIPNPKDRVESDLRRAVCAGRESLAQAQTAIRLDWATADPR